MTFKHMSSTDRTVTILPRDTGDEWRVSASMFAFDVCLEPDGRVEIRNGRKEATATMSDADVAELRERLHEGDSRAVLKIFRAAQLSLDQLPDEA